MIVSHTHKYIFIHCRKAAGSSVKTSLARYFGPKDIQIGSMHDSIAYGVKPYFETYKRLFLSGEFLLGAYLAAKTRKKSEFFNHPIKRSYRNKFGFTPEHPTAQEMKAAFPNEWEHYFKFCIVRNPYQRAVSDFKWRSKLFGRDISFLQYLQAIDSNDALEGLVPKQPDNWPMYTIDNKVSVDCIVKFETLEQDLKEITEELKINWDGWLPRAKASKDKTDYADFYGPREVALVDKLFGHELEAFKYSFADLKK